MGAVGKPRWQRHGHTGDALPATAVCPSGYPLLTYWDDVVSYRAYVPPAPVVSSAGSTSLNVDRNARLQPVSTPLPNTPSASAGALTRWAPIGCRPTARWHDGGLAVGMRRGQPRRSPAWPRAPLTHSRSRRVTAASLIQPTSLGAGASLAPAPPRLLIQRNGTTLTLTWPTSPGTQLQWTPSLTPPVTWIAVTNEVTVVDGQNTITLTPTGSAGYYRLAPAATQPPQLLIQGNGNTLTLTWPTSPSAQLQWAPV